MPRFKTPGKLISTENVMVWPQDKSRLTPRLRRLTLIIRKYLTQIFEPIKVPFFIWCNWNPASLLKIVHQNRLV